MKLWITFEKVHEYLGVDQADIFIEKILGNELPYYTVGTTRICRADELEKWVKEINNLIREKQVKHNDRNKILEYIKSGEKTGRQKSEITKRYQRFGKEKREQILNELVTEKLVRLEHDKRSQKASAVYISKDGWIARNLEQRKEKEKLGTWTAEEFDAAYTEHLRARLSDGQAGSTSDEQRDVHAVKD